MGPAVERIDFNNPAVGKPANLQNSAVLRMLEEEENRRGGRAGAKRVAWPPPQEGVLDPADAVEHNAVQVQAAPRPQPAKHVEPPPSTITLRKEAPVSQAPAPVYNAQPATATLKGGKHLRGDLKWPPDNVRERMAAEKAQLEELAKGPANRPPRNEKDYTRFFEAHALNDTYPGYKIPPGTQFFRPM